MEKKTEIMFLGNGSYSNRGCEAIVRGTTRLLRQQLGQCSFLSCYFPDENCRDGENEIDKDIIHYPVLFWPKRFSSAWWVSKLTKKLILPSIIQDQIFENCSDIAKRSDAILLLGGDNYTLDYSYPTRHFELLEYSLRHGKQVFFWGASIGPFQKDPVFEQYAINVLKRIKRVYVRETVTLQYLNGLGLEEKTFLSADPAFCMEPTSVPLPLELEEFLSNGCIGINLSPLLAKYQGKKYISHWVQQAAELVNTLLFSTKEPILLIPHVTSEFGQMGLRDDYLFMQKVINLIKAPADRVKLLQPNYSASQLKWIISRLRVFAGARTHSTIAAISSCVPTICLGYSIKAMGISKDVFGNLDLLIGSKELEPKLFTNRVQTLLSRENEIRDYLVKIVPVFKARAKDAAEDLGGYLTSR